jgi:putative DNA primase/helicase
MRGAPMDKPLLTKEEIDAAIAERIAKTPPKRDRRKAAHDKQPTIELRIGETERAVDELESLLIASKRGLYQRGGLIVSTGFAKMQTWDGKAIVTQTIEERGDYALLEDAEAVAKFARLDAEGNARPAPPPAALIRTLKDRKHQLRLPVLVGIVNCPSISADGQLLDRPGYDPKTGVLYDPLGVIFSRVPSSPDRRTALAALERILKLLETFDFVSDDDKAVALSLIFTAIARRGLPTAPLHGFDAPVAGSGKSMLVDIASTLATGHEAGVIAQGESREEAEKRLAATLMRGSPIIAMDNCELPLEGVLLNQTLTQQRVELRILGFSKMIVAQTTTVCTATGNNLTIKGDLTRRSVVGRLDPKVAQPELRDFAYDPLADAKENRGELVAAVLTALLAYHVAGRPKRPSPPLQSFVKWSDTVRGALLWLGQGDPVGTMTRLREADPTIINLKAVLTAWRDDFGDEPTTAKDAVGAADAAISTREEGTFDRYVRTHTHPALRAALLLVAGRGNAIDTRVLGQWLGKNVDRVVDLGDGDFAAMEMPGMLHGDRRWRVTATKKEG